MNKEKRWVEGSVHNTGKILWTNSNILWLDKLTYNVSNNNEWDSVRFDQHQKIGKPYRWCNCKSRRGRRALQSSRRGSEETGRK